MKTIKQSKIMSDQEKSVADYLQEIGVKYQAVGAGVGINRKGWQCDGWVILFTNNEHKTQNFDYYTGIGHRAVPDYAMAVYKRSPKTQFEKRQLDASAVPVAPFAASVLYCLVSDSNALNVSFDYWCQDFGYDSDSINDYNTYNACCDNAKKLKDIFTREQLNHLAELLQDY